MTSTTSPTDPTGGAGADRRQTHRLRTRGATVAYDVHGDLAAVTAARPALLMVGSPMDASGFGTLASHFADRVLVTYDPRGASRSTVDGEVAESTPEQHADDLHRVIDALGVGPVDVFASSGGAVNALALVARHPEQVRTLVAHEPPSAQVLPDAAEVTAATEDIYATYRSAGWGRAMAKFIALVSRQGPLPASWVEEPDPDPAAFGLPGEDDGVRDDVMFARNLRTCVGYEHDFAALSAASTRIVIGAGEESAGEVACRAAHAVAERLGGTAVVFPSNHAGFLGGEFGQHGDPDAFAATLRRVLDESAPGAAGG